MAALRQAKDFDSFQKTRPRPFRYLHMHSGPVDVLAGAIQAEAAKHRLEVEAVSLDKKLNPDTDLSSPEHHAHLGGRGDGRSLQRGPRRIPVQ